ncbi:PGF-CTERM-anchored ABC transporter substrate-binding protein, partial [Natrialba swarupiae]|uniref:PGF-CTERM-anchored ABC transporter substrate-binding protein n=1 Tax=Natrialba swarupiae TaxID=2448032 RepID=UPI001EE4AB2B
PLAYYPTGDGFTPGTDTFQHDVLEASGLENVAERAEIEGWGEISSEVVVAHDPEWIVYPDWADDPQVPDVLDATTAIQANNTVAVDDNAMSQPAPDIVFVVEDLVATIHPDAYDEIEGDLAALDEALEDDLEAIDDSDETDDSDDEQDETGDDDSDDEQEESDDDADTVPDLECEFPLERTDARGETITLEEEPDRIVTLYPGDAQLAFQVGIEDRVVGMPIGQYTDSLETDGQTDISRDDGVTPEAETIVDLEPDFVLAGNIALADEDLLDTLEEADIPVYVLDTANSIEDVEENVAVTGELSGECERATLRSEWMTDRLSILEDGVDDEDEPLAYYPTGDGFTPGTDTFQHDVLEASGLENVAERAEIEGWGEISSEVVVAHDPEWIVYPDWADDPQVPDVLDATTAIQANNTVAVDDNAMSQPAPDIVFIVEDLVATIHPDAYDEIEGDLAALDEALEDDLEAIDDSSETDDSSSGSSGSTGQSGGSSSSGSSTTGSAGDEDTEADDADEDTETDEDAKIEDETDDDAGTDDETDDEGDDDTETDDADDAETDDETSPDADELISDDPEPTVTEDGDDAVPSVGIQGALLALIVFALVSVGRRSN